MVKEMDLSSVLKEFNQEQDYRESIRKQGIIILAILTVGTSAMAFNWLTWFANIDVPWYADIFVAIFANRYIFALWAVVFTLWFFGQIAPFGG